MSVIEHGDRLFTLRKRNRQSSAFYLKFIASGGYVPTPPNFNVVGYARPSFEYVWEEPESEVYRLKLGLGIEFVIFPQTVTVPNLIGLNISDALTALANASLIGVNNPTDNTATPIVLYGQVFSQDVAPGTQVGQGSVVNLQVQDLTVVPTLIGLSQADALTAISNATLTPVVTTQVSVPPIGVVLLQSLLPGTQVAANASITIVVSIGGAGFRVQAVTSGWYRRTFRNPGDVFDLQQASDFSDYTVNYEIAGGEYSVGWMMQVSQSTPLTEADGSSFLSTFDPNRRFVE